MSSIGGIEFVTGNGGLQMLRITAHDGARAEVYLHGAHVTSWIPAGETGDRLFLSSRAVFRDGEPIRGGIPVCFPQFSQQGPLPNHGLVRTRAWEYAAGGVAPDGSASVTLRCRDNAATVALWPHPFAATLTVVVGGDRLTVSLEVNNTGPATFEFTAALHSYLRVENVRDAVVRGLANLRHRDKAGGVDDAPGSADDIRFTGEVDRVYAAAPDDLALLELTRSLTLRGTGFPDTVVWNPGPIKGASLPDLAPAEAGCFVCVEAAAATRRITLPPATSWTGAQVLTALA